MSNGPYLPDPPFVPWWDDPRCDERYEEEREDAIERAVNRLLDADHEAQLEQEK